jgi:hypothetical protein
MPLFPKKLFQWREPKEFRRLNYACQKRTRRWWSRLVTTLVLAGLFLLKYYIEHENREKLPFDIAFPVALASGMVVAFGFPWLALISSSEVRLFEKHLTRENFRLLYSDVESVCWREMDDFAMLIIKRLDKRSDVVIGVPHDAPLKKIEQFLASRVAVRP